MNVTNKALLEQAAESSLRHAMEVADSDVSNTVEMEQAMKLYDRLIEADKNEVAIEELRKRTQKEIVVRCVEIGVALIAVPVIKYAFNKSLLKMSMLWEDEHTFTTSGGKLLAKGLFDFK